MSQLIQQIFPKDFHPLLREINDPPESLYVQGVLPSSRTTLLTVVGSRKSTSYGRDVVDYLIGGLKGYDISIVSGLALGIDGHAHTAALNAGLHTTAVPGSGLSEKVLYPRSHVQLSQHILESGGALVSELEPEQGAAPWTFPKRNRIMAGMSHAVLIIEATERSGTLITARLTTDYNRELLVVPASIFAASSRGAHQFWKLGATPITTPEDILDVFSIKHNVHDEKQSNLKLSPEEQKIYNLLAEPKTRDEFIEEIALPITQANILLSKLELDEGSV